MANHDANLEWEVALAAAESDEGEFNFDEPNEKNQI